MTDVRYLNRAALVAASTRAGAAAISKRDGVNQPVYAIDLDDLIEDGAPDERRAMHAERMELHWTAERERLWPALQGVRVIDVVWAGELVEGDIELHTWPVMGRGGQHVNVTPTGVLAVHKPTGLAVVAQLRDRVLSVPDLRAVLDRDIVEPTRPTTVVCSDCTPVCNCECGSHDCGCACHREGRR